LRGTSARLAAVAGVVLLAACDGPNQFATPIPGTAPGGADTRAPTVEIQQPRGDSLSAKPLNDSLLVRVDVTDNVGIDSVVFSGIAKRGDPSLGTDQVVARFVPKKVILPAGTRDTTLTRYLIPIPSTIREVAYIVVAAYDGEGNAAVDTTQLALGGPDVLLENVNDGQTVQAGLGLALRVRAYDPNGIILVQLNLTGAMNQPVVKQVTPVSDSVVFDTTVVIPAGTTGAISITASARNTLDVSGQDGPIRVNVVSGTAGDTIAPLVNLVATASDRLEIKDSLSVTVSGQDNTQGSGVQTAGYTVLAIAPSRGDTLIATAERTFTPPRTGQVSENFKVPTFNVDSLNLPDTLVFEVTGYLIDAEGNCAASVGGAGLVRLPCDSLPTGEIVASNRAGLRLTRTVVSGRTVTLPTGGQIMDAVIDTLRRNLYLSNIVRSQVEIFRLQQEQFLPPVRVGSEPLGLALNRGRDTLLVANSGGTNISNISLGSGGGTGPYFEDVRRRLLTPDVILFEVQRLVDQLGVLRYKTFFIADAEPPGFSDRPQYMAVDSTGRVLFSTKTTELGDFGTIRQAFVPDDQGRPAEVRPEVKLFFEHGQLSTAAEFVAIGNIDNVVVVPGATNDEVILTDHVPGFPNDAITGGPALVEIAAAELAAAGSDIVAGTGRFSVPSLGFSDTTFVTASGDGGWALFGEGSVDPVGRLIMYEAARDRISKVVEVHDLMTNASETVRGIGLNYDGTLGVARGFQAYFFTTDLRLQGVAALPPGGAGAVIHPLHANAQTLTNYVNGEYRPDTHMAFVGTGERTIDIIDTSNFGRSGRLFIRDVIQGPLRAVLPFPEDNVGLQCATIPVTDQAGAFIGNAIQIFENGDFLRPIAPDGVTEDSCIVVKLFGVTNTGGVVVVDVRKADILRDHPSR
jgi:hypothetical protein